jgi:hypothetical protein
VFLGRSTAAIANERFHSQIYVDDPAFSCRGTINEAATQFAIALLWATALGDPLAWRKADGGGELSWIGAAIATHPTNVEVSFARDKCKQLAVETSAAFNRTIIATRKLALLGRLPQFRRWNSPPTPPILGAISGCVILPETR